MIDPSTRQNPSHLHLLGHNKNKTLPLPTSKNCLYSGSQKTVFTNLERWWWKKKRDIIQFVWQSYDCRRHLRHRNGWSSQRLKKYQFKEFRKSKCINLYKKTVSFRVYGGKMSETFTHRNCRGDENGCRDKCHLHSMTVRGREGNHVGDGYRGARCLSDNLISGIWEENTREITASNQRSHFKKDNLVPFKTITNESYKHDSYGHCVVCHLYG